MGLQRRLKVMTFGANAMPLDTAVKIAFASSDMKRVDQHFGAAESFAVYAVDPRRYILAEVIQFEKSSMDGNEDKLASKIAALSDCIAVYCQAVGASAINQLLALSVQPIKVSSGTSVSELIGSLQQELRAGPSAWLARAIESHQPRDSRRFDSMEAEGWSE